MALTEVQCKKADVKEKQYRLTDINGLSLVIDPNGKKYWSLRFTVNGQRKSKAIGKYPDLSLKAARELTITLKANAESNTMEIPQYPCFQEVGDEWFNKQKDAWSVKHIKNVRASLDELNKFLGDCDVSQITAPEILTVIKSIESRGSLEIAKRTLSRCGMVMKYAIALGYRYDDPSNGLTHALKPQKVTNLASLPMKEMEGFLKAIHDYPCKPQILHAIKLIMLTGVRVNELLQAKWNEFDFDDKIWDVPAERMKNRMPHRVPLTDFMINELQALRSLHTSELLFPHRLDFNKAMTSEAILNVIKRSGYAGKMTTHGFRSLFSTTLNESNLFNPDAIERQLAHVPQNRIRSAYNRALYWDERVKMMEWYSQKIKEILH